MVARLWFGPMHPFLLAAWASWQPGTCFPDDCFCEAIQGGLIRQPANTWSSFAFVLVALWVLRRQGQGARAGRPPLPSAQAWVFVGSLALVGVGSAFYHASLTFVGQVIDVSGMYLIATFILLHRLAPKWGLSPVRSVLGFVGANAVLMVAQVTTPSLRRIVFGLLLVSALLVEARASREGRRWLAGGAALMVMAFAVWSLDRWRLVCAPESPWQGHAVWHGLGALAAACLFRSYEADAPGPHPQVE